MLIYFRGCLEQRNLDTAKALGVVLLISLAFEHCVLRATFDPH